VQKYALFYNQQLFILKNFDKIRLIREIRGEKKS